MIEFRFPEEGNILIPKVFRQALEPKSSVQGVPEAPSPGLQRSGREPGHSSISSGEVKHTGRHTSSVPYIFMSWYLLWYKDNIIFKFYPLTSLCHELILTSMNTYFPYVVLLIIYKSAQWLIHMEFFLGCKTVNFTPLGLFLKQHNSFKYGTNLDGVIT
jgi:hypothetical protein